MTLFKLTDFISSRRSSHIVNNTLLRAYPTLLYMIWTIIIVATLMSSIIFLTERGEYTVNQDYPHGAFLRPDILHSSKEESPFKSILLSMYYVLVTMTSTGYGDLYCTSALGRFLSNILMCSAVLILALPIAVLGNILSEEVNRYLKKKEDRRDVVEKQLKTGQRLPVFKYRRGPSLIGQTMRRLSSISLLSQTSPRHRSQKQNEIFSFDSFDNGNGSQRTPVPSVTLRRGSTQKRKSSLPDEVSALNQQPLLSNSSSSSRRLSQTTLEKVRKLSVNSLVQFVETQQQPFQQNTQTLHSSSNFDKVEDDFEGSGIVLNPMKTLASPSQRSSSLGMNGSPTHSPSTTNFTSNISSSSSTHLPKNSISEFHLRLRDVEHQIESYSNSYQDRMKECLDLYHQIQIQMKIRNDLLKSLAKDCTLENFPFPESGTH
jgi:hypothetical protein